MRILVADPASDGCEGLLRLLEDAGHAVEHTTKLEDLDEVGLSARFDLLVLTRPFGPRDVAELRRIHPALALLALTEPVAEARVEALEAGADDALSVPFAGSQLLARTHALGRRAALVPRAPEIVEVDGCFIDLGALKVSRGGPPVDISAREAKLIRFLLRHAGRAVGRDEILEHVFEVSPEIESRSVDMAIAVLRKKLERDPRHPRVILSVKGVGYRWGDLTQT